MGIRLIETEQDYDLALKQAWSLMDAEAGTSEAAELEMLAGLIETYEERHFPMDLPESIGSEVP